MIVKDESVIPTGPFCYSIVPIVEGEILSDDIERFGKELREFRYHGDTKEVLCPYWRRTDYGTVICDFLHKEVYDEENEDARALIEAKFGKSEPGDKIGHSWALPDELKICGIHDPDSE